MKPRTLYFAHPSNMKGTELEADFIKLLLSKWPDDTIVLTGEGAHLTAEKVVILPFPDGMWGTDEWQIASEVLNQSDERCVWVIDPITRVICTRLTLPYSKRLTSGQTIARLYS